MTRNILALSAALLAVPGSAWACGGFFCNSDAPVVQNAERIVFGVDADAGTVDTHVQISYSGPAEQFAWVVPVQTLPELFLSTDELFRVLDQNTRPQFNLDHRHLGNCWTDAWEGDADADADADGDADADSDTDTGGGVTVIEESRVGPYDTAILQATSDSVLIDWLQDNGYDIPATMGPALAPYIASGHYVIALKLTKGSDTGDLAPIGFTYPGTTPGIPIQLTSVAASPDMRLEAYVLGEHRYVPQNYLHVQINPLKINWEPWWWQGGNGYEGVVTLAADEAGGHAFATDYAGAPPAGQMYRDGWFPLHDVRTATTAIAAIDAVQGAGFSGTSVLMDILLDYIAVPEGVDPRDFLNFPSGYDPVPVDGDALADALDERLVQPLVRAEAMMEAPTLSRMTSSLSPAEMTVDPMFTANPDMGDVDNVHIAVLTTDCRQINDAYHAPRSFEVPDGPEVLVPSQAWLDDENMDLVDYLSTISDTNALIIEATGASGLPQPLVDHSDLLAQQIDEANDALPGIPGTGWSDDESQASAGCGCSSTRGIGLGLGMLPLGLLLRRRRA